MQLQGANSGILLTLGTADGAARDVARRYGVELIDGGALWPKVQDYRAGPDRRAVRLEAADKTKRGQWIGAGVSVLAGIVLFAATFPFNFDAAPQAQAAATATRRQPGRRTASTRKPSAINAAAKAMAKVAKMTECRTRDPACGSRDQGVRHFAGQQRRSGRRSRRSSVNLNSSDGQDTELITEVCRILIQYEELRYTRVQLDPPMNTQIPVRWRQCQ